MHRVMGLAAFVGMMATATVAQDRASRAELDVEPEKSGISVLGSFDLTTAYFSRGYLYEDRGVIFQPDLAISLTLSEGEWGHVAPFVGTWNSFHSAQTGTTGRRDAWFESNVYAGVEWSIGDFTLAPMINYVTYPNGAGSYTWELIVPVEYDDTAFWQRHFGPDSTFALRPSVELLYELYDRGGSEDIYFQVGLTPSFDVQFGRTPVTVSFPMRLGMSFRDYYFTSAGEETTLGFASIGVGIRIPLNVPERYGKWAIGASVEYLHLLAGDLEVINDGRQDVLIGTVNLSFEL